MTDWWNRPDADRLCPTSAEWLRVKRQLRPPVPAAAEVGEHAEQPGVGAEGEPGGADEVGRPSPPVPGERRQQR
ncbi:MAG TPA: hypothetical protein VEA69_05540 [Tepidisphaeraceae bacterium]|nr:hypothetical protein [Tepidisphaeraceae bacterium]